MDRAQESSAIFIGAWEVLGKGSPASESRRGGLIEVSWCGYASPFFNLAVTCRPPASLKEFEDAVVETSAWAAERHCPWLLAVCHETLNGLLPEAERALGKLGFTPMMPLTGMEAYELTPPARSRPGGAWLTEAYGETGGHVIRLNEAAYQVELGQPGSMALERPGWWQAPERMATVLLPNGDPASCAAVLGVDGLRYAALVATLPAEQRKGYAEFAMRDVLERSRAAGLGQRMYLHATAAGRPVYERMGYRTTAEYTVYVKNQQ